MSLRPDADTRRHPLRVAVIAAAIAVAGCFTAAFTFADDSAQAAPVGKAR